MPVCGPGSMAQIVIQAPCHSDDRRLPKDAVATFPDVLHVVDGELELSCAVLVGVVVTQTPHGLPNIDQEPFLYLRALLFRMGKHTITGVEVDVLLDVLAQHVLGGLNHPVVGCADDYPTPGRVSFLLPSFQEPLHESCCFTLCSTLYKNLHQYPSPVWRCVFKSTG